MTAATPYDVEVREIASEEATPCEDAPCPVCGDPTARPRFSVQGVSSPVVVCSACGHGRFHPMLEPPAIHELYSQDYYGAPTSKFRQPVEFLVRLVGARHTAFLASGLRPGARVLDVGCGRGVILTPLADKGLEVHGVEVNEHASAGADSRASIRIAPDLGEAGYDDGYFDEVIVWHVLEHLPDPGATLAEIHRILRPGGRVIIAVPNFASAQARWSGAAWFHLDLPRHLHHFPLPALEQLLTDSGFEVTSRHHFSLRQNPFGWIQSALNRWTSMPNNALYVLLHHGSTATYDWKLRVRLWASLALGAPFALVATVVAALARSGATVHVVAERRASEGEAVHASAR